jgi:hypothetical protein
MNKRERSRIARRSGKLAAGKPKNYSEAELQRRREQMSQIGLERARRIRAMKAAAASKRSPTVIG